jgi:hypothetical protein
MTILPYPTKGSTTSGGVGTIKGESNIVMDASSPIAIDFCLA